MNNQEHRLLAVTCYGHFMSHFNMLVFPSIVLPLTRLTGLDLAVVLGMSFWQYLLFGVTALPWGLAADRWGAKPLMLLFFLGVGISGTAAGLFMDSPVALTLALAGIGLFSGIYHPAGLGMISKGFRNLSMGMAYNGMFGNLGLATAPLITGLVTWYSGPSGAYFALAAFNFIGFFLTIFLRMDVIEVDRAGERLEDGASYVPFIILLVAMMLGGVAYRGATVILPTYFEIRGENLYAFLSTMLPDGLSANLVATTLASIIYVIGMLGQYSGGLAGQRYDARKAYLVFHLLTLPPVFLMALATDASLVFLGVVYFFFLLGMQPVENTLVARLSPPRFHHSAYGAKFILTFGVGALAVKMVGAIEGSWGLTWVFPALGLVSVVLVLTVLLLITRTGPIRPGQAK